jgi:3D (Asp-Asp-Asp) domain-containing protein
MRTLLLIALLSTCSCVYGTRMVKMNVTAYCSHKHRTATGTRPRPGICAMPSRSFLGYRVYVPGVGWLVCRDVCGTKGTCDVYMISKGRCIRYGRKYLTVKILGKVKLKHERQHTRTTKRTTKLHRRMQRVN